MISELKLSKRSSVFSSINFDADLHDNIICNSIREKSQNITNIFDLFGHDNKKITELPSPPIKRKQTQREKNKVQSQTSLATIYLPIISKENHVITVENCVSNNPKKKIDLNSISYNNKSECNSYHENKSNMKKRGIISLKKKEKKSLIQLSPDKTRNSSLNENTVKANLVSNKKEIFKGVVQECENGRKNLDKNIQEIEKLTFVKNQSNVGKILDRISFNQFGEGLRSVLGSPICENSYKNIFPNVKSNKKLNYIISENLSYKSINTGRESQNNETGNKNKKSLHSYVNKLINQSERKKKDLILKLDLRESNIF